MRGSVEMEDKVKKHGLPGNAHGMRTLKAMGFSDARLAVRALRVARGQHIEQGPQGMRQRLGALGLADHEGHARGDLRARGRELARDGEDESAQLLVGMFDGETFEAAAAEQREAADSTRLRAEAAAREAALQDRLCSAHRLR